jgi:hypothetical protein
MPTWTSNGAFHPRARGGTSWELDAVAAGPAAPPGVATANAASPSGRAAARGR